jgi:hypothetical protein
MLNLIPGQDNEFRQIHAVKVPAQGSPDNELPTPRGNAVSCFHCQPSYPGGFLF